MKKTIIVCLLIICVIAGVIGACGGKEKKEEEKGQAFSWPDTEIGRLLPETDAKATSTNFTEEMISADLVMSADEFKDYIDKCKEKGFTEKPSASENDTYAKYSASNEEQYALTLTLYKEDGECHLSLTAPEGEADEEPEEDKSEKKKEKKSKKSSGGVTPEFKAAMDEYEEFFDDYVDLMKKYNENPAAYLTEYAQFMTQYSETMEKLDAIDSDSLSDADSAYYLEVMARINAKLAEVAY